MKHVFTTLTILLFLCNCTGFEKDSSIIDSIKIVNHMLNYKDNHISVRLKECNDTIINTFKSTILDDKCIVFIKDDPNDPIIIAY